MDSNNGHDDGQRLIDELAASFYSPPFEEIIRNPEPASSSSAASPIRSSYLDWYGPPPPPPPPPPPYWTGGPKANWLLLPQDVLVAILVKLGALEIIESAQKVCKLWRSVCMDPSMWTSIEMGKLVNFHYVHYDLEELYCHAIDRSRGGCVDISFHSFGDDRVLNHIIESGCKLTRLRMVRCLYVSDEGIVKAAPGLSFLETFEYYGVKLDENVLNAIGKNCPRLTTLIVEQESYLQFACAFDDEAFAIAKSMPSLRHLSLFGNRLTNRGLEAILDGCPRLESLDLRKCFNVGLMGDLARKSERIKDLKRPWDSTAGCMFHLSNSRVPSLLPPPPMPYLTQDPNGPLLQSQMDSSEEEDLRLIDVLSAPYYENPFEEILRDCKASSRDGNDLIIWHPEASSSSSSTNATAQLFHLNSPHPPPPPPAHWAHGLKANWLLLPREVLTTIFLKLGAIDIIESAQKVCSLWHSVAMDPSLWTQIDIRNDRNHDELPSDLVLICHHAIKRSCGGCVDVSIEHFGDDYLLGYIINSGCPLRHLRLIHCLEVSNEGLSNMAAKLTLLETFETYYSCLSEKALVAIGQNCPYLTTLKFIKGQSRRPRKDADREAFAIAKHMPGLKHLTLIGNKLTNKGLKAILDGCPHLESLDLRQSYNVDLRGDIVKQCGWINNLRHPLDPFDGYGSDDMVEDDYYAYSDDSLGSDDLSNYSYYSPPPPPPRYWTRGPKPNWLELPREILTDILLKLGTIEIIVTAQMVCTLWRDVCTDPSTWTRIDMRSSRYLPNMPYNLAKICRHAIDLSRGGCVDINLEGCGDDDLLNHIVERGCLLRCLRVMHCWSISDEGMAEAARRMPFLETFEYCFGNFEKNALMSIGMNCPRLTTFVYGNGCRGQSFRDIDDGAFAIAKSMPGLRRLSLSGSGITNKGLGAILEGCPHLESLDLHDCYNIDLKSGDLAKKCERIKDMRWPPNATASRFDGYDLSFDPLDRCSEYNYLDDSSDYSDEYSVYDYEGNSYNHWEFFGY